MVTALTCPPALNSCPVLLWHPHTWYSLQVGLQAAVGGLPLGGGGGGGEHGAPAPPRFRSVGNVASAAMKLRKAAAAAAARQVGGTGDWLLGYACWGGSRSSILCALETPKKCIKPCTFPPPDVNTGECAGLTPRTKAQCAAMAKPNASETTALYRGLLPKRSAPPWRPLLCSCAGGGRGARDLHHPRGGHSGGEAHAQQAGGLGPFLGWLLGSGPMNACALPLPHFHVPAPRPLCPTARYCPACGCCCCQRTCRT